MSFCFQPFEQTTTTMNCRMSPQICGCITVGHGGWKRSTRQPQDAGNIQREETLFRTLVKWLYGFFIVTQLLQPQNSSACVSSCTITRDHSWLASRANTQCCGISRDICDVGASADDSCLESQNKAFASWFLVCDPKYNIHLYFTTCPRTPGHLSKNCPLYESESNLNEQTLCISPVKPTWGSISQEYWNVHHYGTK